VLEAIRSLIEWIANDAGPALATLFPFMIIGLLGLYLLALLVGYLRVSQVGIGEGHAGAEVIRLPESGTDLAIGEARRGVPYCPHDRLAYPVGARFCAACERDLQIDCVACGATLNASETSCYRCGTRTGAVAEPVT
jgi:hypothetical protein